MALLVETRPQAAVGPCVGRWRGAQAGALWLDDGRAAAALPAPSPGADVWRARRGEWLAHDGRARVVWDQAGGWLRAVRDRLGLMPLWYAGGDEGVILSSDPAWALATRGGARQVNPERLAAFLTRRDGLDEDFFRGLYRLPAGAELRWDVGQGLRVVTRTPWQAPHRATETFEARAGALWESLVARLRLHDREPVTVALSGGVDSGALAAALVASRSQRPIQGVSMVSRRHPGLDESEVIDAIEATLPVRSRRWTVDEAWPLRDLDPYTRHLAFGPQQHAGAGHLIPFYEAMIAATGSRRYVTGEGGDQLFATTHRELLGWFTRTLDARRAHGLLRYTGPAFLLLLAGEGLVTRGPRALTAASARFGQRRRAARARRAPWRDPATWVTRDAWLVSAHQDHLARRLRAGWPRRITWTRSWVWEGTVRLLQLVSRESGARLLHPLLDEAIVTFTLDTPPDMFVREQLMKALLREALRGRLPESVTRRPKLKTFDPLLERALGVEAHPFVKACFEDSLLHDMGLIDAGRFRDALRQYRVAVLAAGQAGPPVVSTRVWRTIAAEVWLRALHGALPDPSCR